MAGATGVVRLTPDNLIAANLVITPKGTTTVSVTMGDICKLSTGKWRAVSTITDGTKSATLGVAENRSPGSGVGNSRQVSCYMADEAIDYEVGLNTLTSINVGDYMKLVTTKCQQVAKSTTVTDDRVARAVKAGGSSTVNKATVRFLRHVHDLERG